ncbi:MAG: thiol peroxidase [Polyangiales bacterium]|jgi:thiol peroxidase
MATITFKGGPVELNGELPSVGADAPPFTLVGADLQEKSLSDFPGKKVLTINPSYDTGICQKAAAAFNSKAAGKDISVLMISADLPFAQKRFCSAEGVDGVIPLSTFRSSFSDDYGVTMKGGPLQGLTARAVLVVDENNKVIYSELVPEIVEEPNYDAALAAL